VITEFARVVSSDVGLVHRLDDGLTGYDHPRLAAAFAQSCALQPVFGVPQQIRAGGLDPDPDAARRAAVGEAIERYSACHVPRSRLRSARAGDLGDTVAPAWLEPPDDDPVLDWVPGTKLPGGAPAWVAASRVYLQHIHDPAPVVTATSTGLASHPDPWQALHAGLLEVIERDAVMITWLTRAAVTPIRTTLRWRTDRGAQIRFDRALETYALFLLDSPIGVPVVFAVALGAECQPGLAVGAAAHLDLATACRSALVEAAQTLRWAATMLASGREVGTDPGAFTDFDDHVAYYLDPARRGAVDFLVDSDVPPIEVDLDAPRPRVDPADASRTILRRAHGAGLSCYAVDVTAPDVRSTGTWVVRAVIPQLYPLLLGPPERRPAHPRLPADAAVNPDPHPFP
jgi:ribosomal protein S12 methylthiotransferase accessory factor